MRHREFRLLAGGVTISALGSAMTSVAFAFAVLDLGGTAVQLGLVLGGFALAEVVTTLFGGVLGDRVSRRVMLRGTSAALAVLQGVVAAALFTGHASVPMLSVTNICAGCLIALSTPSSSATTPLTVPADVLPAAIALRRLGMNAATVVGLAVAGVVVAAWGSGVAIAVDAASYVVAAVCFARLRIPDARAERGPSMLHDLGAGARAVFALPWLWMLILAATGYHLFYAGVQVVLGPVVVGERLGRAAWGASLSALTLGFVLGGLLTLRWRPRRALFVGTLALTLTAFFPVAMAFSPNAAGLVAGAALHGLGLEIFSVWWDTSIQQNVAPELLARVYAFDNVGSFAARPAGIAATGVVAQAVGQTEWLLVVAGIMVCLALVPAAVPAVRRLERRDAAPADSVAA